MKIHPSSRPHGSTLCTVLLVTAVLFSLVTAYLMLLGHTNRATMRSQKWNMAIPVAEAGVEDALTHLNVNGPTTLAKDGWTQVANQNVFWKEESIDGHKYLVTISNYVAGVKTNQPVIESRAFIEIKLASIPVPFFANIGANTIPETHIAAGIRVKTGQRNSMSKGMISKGSFQIQSLTSIPVDSYDSSSEAHSTGGRYDPAKRRQQGYIGTNSRVSGNMQVQSAKILGTAGTGATGVLTMQSPASVGDLAWVNSSAGAGKVKPGHLDSNLNLPFPDVPVPFTSGFWWPGSGTYNGTNYTYLLNLEGRYRIDKILLLDSSKRMVVTADATLYVTDALLVDSGHIIVLPGKTLTVYVEKAFEAKGDARINADGLPMQFMYYGRPFNTSFQVLGNARLVGVFYAPGADGQFKDYSSLCGGGTFNTLQLQHYFEFHYDEALGGSAKQLFFVTKWDELDPQEARTLPVGTSVTLP
jgi:hypothetical protein